jgi:hypothetical protein
MHNKHLHHHRHGRKRLVVESSLFTKLPSSEVIVVLTELDWAYLGGLADGEAWIGVGLYKSDRYSTGYHLNPVFQIALGEPNKSLLEFWQKELGGTITANRLKGFAWVVRGKGEVDSLLLQLRNFVRFETNKRRIDLVREIIKVNPSNTPSDPRALEPLVKELRSMSRRKRNLARYWV